MAEAEPLQDGPALVAGFQYRLVIELSAPVLLSDPVLVGHARAQVRSQDVVAELSTGDGSLVVKSET